MAPDGAGVPRPVEAEDLYRSPNALAEHYRRFRVDERVLLSGHSHQAWPDRALAGQLLAWEDAADLVDGKWARAEAKADRVRRGFARLLGDRHGDYALAPSVHVLLVRLLSALALRERPRIVTTDAEFHSARRQLARLAEEGIEVVQVAALPAASVGERLAASVDDRTAAVVASTVFFSNGQIAGDLSEVMGVCSRFGAALVLDTYHQLNIVPFSLSERGLDDAFVVGGGYKYCQLGEGNCFLRLPPDCELRPVVTGWFAEFDRLQTGVAPGSVRYAPGASRFAGSTYDPTSHYRAAEVFDFFVEAGLDAALLRRVSQHQIELLISAFDALDLDPQVIDRDRGVSLSGIGGFLALSTPRAAEICRRLLERDVFSDARGSVLRLGPAPYLSDRQLRDAMSILGVVARDL